MRTGAQLRVSLGMADFVQASIRDDNGSRAMHRNYAYRAPRELRRTGWQPKRVLVVGSCLMNDVVLHINKTNFNFAEHILFNNLGDLPAKSVDELRSYDMQIVQFPLRSILPEASYSRLSYAAVEEHRKLFHEARTRLAAFLELAMAYSPNGEIPTFVTNFLTPQQSPMGRFAPRYDIRNPRFFIEELNRALWEEVAAYASAYVADIDEISATFGRRYIQDDMLWVSAHGSTLANFDPPRDQQRIEPPSQDVVDYYPLRTGEFVCAVWHEIEAMHATITGIDNVKMVVVDLDDTLWRGVVAEQSLIDNDVHEGWPRGFMEALAFLKKRGVLLAVISKNDRERVEPLWDRIVGGVLSLDDFIVTKINWEPKIDNMEAVLSAANLLPRNVVYIDDNPVERAQMAAAFPDLRVLGSELYYLRRILLWSPETQTPSISAESQRRTEMVRYQIQRDEVRKKLSRAEFLASLDVRNSFVVVTGADQPEFARCAKLINKTNQFNTTGKRWANPHASPHFG